MVCFLVATFAVLLLHTNLAAVMQQPSERVSIHAHAEGRCAVSGTGPAQQPGLSIIRPTGQAIYSALHGQTHQTKYTAMAPGELHENIAPNRQMAAQYASNPKHCSRDCWNAVLWGVGLLVCNALLGFMGLIVRTGHDAMHRAAASPLPQHVLAPAKNASELVAASHAVHSDASGFASLHWLSSGLFNTQELLAPIIHVMIVPFLLLATTKQTHSIASGGLGHFRRLQASSLKLIWSSYLILALYWLVMQLHREDSSVASRFEHMFAALPGVAAVRAMLSLQDTEYVLSFCHSQLQNSLSYVVTLSSLVSQPLKLVMPRLLFVLSAFAVLLLALTKVLEHWHPVAALKSESCHHRANYSLLAALAAPVLLMSGPENGAICALGALECTCTTELFHLLTNHWKNASPEPGAEGNMCDPGMPEGWLGVAEGCMWALLSMQLFLCTGHFCEFAGLQYAAGKSCMSACLHVHGRWTSLPVLTVQHHATCSRQGN